MKNRKDMASELLRQNGLEPGRLTEDERARCRRLLARDEARVRRMKWAALVSWGMVVAVFMVGAVIASVVGQGAENRAGIPGLLPVLALGTFWVAVACTVSWFLRSRSLGRRQILEKLTDIEAQLARLQSGESRPQDGPTDAA